MGKVLFVFCQFVILVVLIWDVGVCQESLRLESNNTDIYACAGESVAYMCVCNCSFQQWILSNLSIPPLGIFRNSLPSRRENSLTYSVLERQPFISELIVYYTNTINSTSIQCEAGGIKTMSILYRRVYNGFSPYINFVYGGTIQHDPSYRLVLLEWNNDADILQYHLYCKNNTCEPQTLPKNATSAHLKTWTYDSVIVVLELISLCSENYSVTYIIPEEIVHTTTSTTMLFNTHISNSMDKVTFSGTTIITTTYTSGSVNTDSEMVESSTTLIGGIAGGVLALVTLSILLTFLVLIWILQNKRKTRTPSMFQSRHVKDDDVEYAKTVHMMNLKPGSPVDVELDVSMYSITTHPRSNQDFSQATDAYSHTNHKKNQNVNGCEDTAYAELELNVKKNVAKIPSPNNVVYSTVTVGDDVQISADSMLDLNMALIQLANIEHLWESYGRALGIPEDILEQVEKMNAGSKEKLIEVLDYWFFMHSKDCQPSWKDIARGLKIIGYVELAAKILEVYSTGKLPIEFEENAPAQHFIEAPPLPPKISKETLPPLLPKKAIDTENDNLVPPPRPPKLKK